MSQRTGKWNVFAVIRPVDRAPFSLAFTEEAALELARMLEAEVQITRSSQPN